MKEPMEILNALDKGEISVDRAVFLLKECNENNRCADMKVKPVRKGHWLKIRVKGDGHNIRFYVPISILNFGFSMSKLVMSSRFIEDNDEGIQIARNVLNSIDRKDMKSLVNAIKESGKTDIVQVIDGDTCVNISIV